MLAFTPEQLLELIKRCANSNLTFTQIQTVTGLGPDELNTIMVNNIRLKKYKRSSPASMPNSYYIDRFKKGMTVKEIAVELGCNLSGLYRVLNYRGISQYTYTKGASHDHTD